MAPKHRRKAGSSGTSSAKTSEREGPLEARALKRAERFEARRIEAEKHKEAGNVHFRAGDYFEAIEEYRIAIETHGPSAPYLSNIAAAWLKLEEYSLAEDSAQRALDLDPRFMKARYRRGLARKGNFELARASVDFRTILKQDPESTEARDALRETLALMRERDEDDDDDVAVSEDEYPVPSATKVELESVSDSSDWNHEGNGIPCRFYNHDGCMRGTDCRFSHAPDHKSVRDRLGRNVCMYFLLGYCKFGDSACVYSHDKVHLPPGRWWDDEGKRLLLRHISKSLHPAEHSAFMPYMFGIADDRLAWASAHGVEMEDHFEHNRERALEGFRDAADAGLAAAALNGLSHEPPRDRYGRGSGHGQGQGKGGRGGRVVQDYDLDDDDDEVDSEIEERMANLVSRKTKQWNCSPRASNLGMRMLG
ncbi:hypothetical protein BC826DRAFT_1109520 [Russula brevipes]|nr:hypothetical protein BC826DRAFT_1109520 [Russula brevipes]